MKIAFLGAVGTVTGSRFLVQTQKRRILVDCGLFQGYKPLRRRNWRPFPVPPASIDTVVLTHAHLDHSGYLPRLIKEGFAGPVLCSAGTRDLCGILLPDSGHLQEEEASYAGRHGYSRHSRPEPLYTRAEAEASLERFQVRPKLEEIDLGYGLRMELRPAGHLLGACSVWLSDQETSILFSGDLGRPSDPVLGPASPPRPADYVVVESTYGNRVHPAEDPADTLERILLQTLARGGILLVPSFAVGRAQLLLHHLTRLKKAGRIPDLPVFLDSPMAVRSTRVFCDHTESHLLSQETCDEWYRNVSFIATPAESKTLARRDGAMIIISASGMATGGRILHHLKVFAGDHRNTILFAGFQAPGTRGAAMVAGAGCIKIHGEYHQVNARVEMMETLSAHADREEILAWLSPLKSPRCCWVVHGEPEAADAFRMAIQERLGWRVEIPELREFESLGDPGPEATGATP